MDFQQVDAMIGKLKQMCDGLSLQDKVELREYLSDIISSVKGVVRKTPLRCSILMGEMADIMGVRAISYVSRIPLHVWARAMVAYQMILEGYTTMEISQQMCKNHATIHHLKIKMRDALSMPQIYQDILPSWNELQKRIDNDIYK